MSINSSDLVNMAQATNGILHGYYFGWFTLFIVAFVVFVYMISKRYSIMTSLAASGWMTAILVLFLKPLNLIDNYTFWFGLLCIPVAIFCLWLSGRD